MSRVRSSMGRPDSRRNHRGKRAKRAMRLIPPDRRGGGGPGWTAILVIHTARRRHAGGPLGCSSDREDRVTAGEITVTRVRWEDGREAAMARGVDAARTKAA